LHKFKNKLFQTDLKSIQIGSKVHSDIIEIIFLDNLSL
jgi:hypothetical protein